MKLKVYSGTVQAPVGVVLEGQAAHNRQARVIVGATSMRRAAELLNESVFGPGYAVSNMRNWWTASGNATDLATATHEGVWYRPLDRYQVPYRVAPPRKPR